MHDGDPRHGFVLPDKENISGTNRAAKIENSSQTHSGEGCVFIEAFSWPAGFPPFCGQPIQPGSAYCPVHAAVCALPKAVRSER
jgi:hypothetical protein